MKTPNRYVDILVLSVMVMLLGLLIYRHFTDGIIISINNMLAFLALPVSFYYWIKGDSKGRYTLLILLLLSASGFINFMTYTSRVGSIYSVTDVYLYLPGIEPLMFLTLIVYAIINKTFVFESYLRFKLGSDEEQKNDLDKMTAFYYDKFNSYSVEEFDKLYSKYDTYPTEAKAAFNKIVEERKSTLSI